MIRIGRGPRGARQWPALAAEIALIAATNTFLLAATTLIVYGG